MGKILVFLISILMDYMALSVVSYSPKNAREHKSASASDAKKIRDSVVWVDVGKPTKKDMEELAKTYGFHHLTVEDCLHEIQRPKVEDYQEYLFMITRAIESDNGKITTKQLAAYVGEDYVVTVHKKEIPALDEVRKQILDKNKRILNRGTDFLIYRILDAVVDNYFVVIGEVEEKIERIENEVVRKPTKHTLERIFRLRKDLLLIRKPIWPQREVLHTLQGGHHTIIDEATTPYFRDIYDHSIQVIDLIETYREILTGALDAYLSSVSNTLNEVMKVLTVLASLLLIPTLISGIYGMNYTLIPPRQWEYGFHFAILLMLASMSVFFLYFKKKDWV